MIQPNPTFSAIQIALRRKRTNKRQLLTAIASCEKAFAHIEALEAVVGKAYVVYQNDGRAFRDPIATLDEIGRILEAALQRLQERQE